MGCASSKPSFGPPNFQDTWQVAKTLGRGNFSTVLEVHNKNSSEIAAAKCCGVAKLERRQSVENEIYIWQMVCHHENIVALFETHMAKSECFMVMERCAGSLASFIPDEHIGEICIPDTLLQILSGLVHLHSLSVAHRDIKPSNCLFGGRHSKIVKLCDFGLSAVLPRSGNLYGTYGTVLYMSPEMIGSGPHNLKTDVWSLGVLAYLLLYGSHPYGDNTKYVKEAIASGESEPTYSGTRETTYGAQQFVSLLLCREASNRISARKALSFAQVPSQSSKSDIKVEESIDDASTCTPMTLASSSHSNFDTESTLARESLQRIRSL